TAYAYNSSLTPPDDSSWSGYFLEGVQAFSIQLTVFDNRPLISKGEVGEPRLFILGNSSQPSNASDWITLHSPFGGTLMVHNGAIFAAYQRTVEFLPKIGGFESTFLARAVTNPPLTAEDWQIIEIDRTTQRSATGGGSPVRLSADASGRIGLLYVFTTFEPPPSSVTHPNIKVAYTTGPW
ncbi:MAG: hypothetical protein ABI743_03935, partial [bacterium]